VAEELTLADRMWMLFASEKGQGLVRL
jgi:hypothetical protein